MDRAELYMADTYKREELKKRLKPITDWNKVKVGTRMFHNTDNNIYNINIFQDINEDGDIISYYNKDNKVYTMSATGWYYYDESIADEVEELYTPKLYDLIGMKTVAFTKEEAFEYLKEKYQGIRSFNVYCSNDVQQISEIDGFEIVLK